MMDPNSIAVVPDDLIVAITPAIIMLAGLTAALVQFAKQIPQVVKFKSILPFVSLGVGVGLAFLWGVDSPAQAGIIAGLIAAGGYDLLKLPGK